MEIFFVYGLALIWPALGVSGLAAGIYFARRHVRALERRRTDAGELGELRQRLAQLEETLEHTQRDVTRLEEGQAFTQRLLSDRAPAAREER
jgi:hypothetical protein